MMAIAYLLWSLLTAYLGVGFFCAWWIATEDRVHGFDPRAEDILWVLIAWPYCLRQQ